MQLHVLGVLIHAQFSPVIVTSDPSLKGAVDPCKNQIQDVQPQAQLNGQRRGDLEHITGGNEEVNQLTATFAQAVANMPPKLES